MSFFAARILSLRKGNVFSRVYHSVQGIQSQCTVIQIINSNGFFSTAEALFD